MIKTIYDYYLNVITQSYVDYSCFHLCDYSHNFDYMNMNRTIIKTT